MPETPDDAQSASPDVVDQAVEAAAGTRRAALWIASGLGAIPSLAILGSLVRAPGDSGYDGTQLVWGIILCAAGATAGILAFAWVISPVSLEDDDLDTLNMRRIPGSPSNSFKQLRWAIEWFRSALSVREDQIIDAEEESAEADAELARTEATATELEKRAKDGTSADKSAARRARQVADIQRQKSDDLKGKAAALTVTAKTWQGEFDERERLRAEAFKLKASDEVSDRFYIAKWIAGASVAAVAAGIALLAVAPNSKAPEASTSPSLVTFTLTKDGHEKLGCDDVVVHGLRVGGTDDAPLIITLPTATCKAQYVTPEVLSSIGETSIGKMKVEPTPSPTESDKTKG